MNTNFLLELRKNNNREWFNSHKDLYLAAKGEFDAFAVRLIQGIYAFDSSVGMQELKTCTYRIYKDMRFSRDGEPYKTWFGAFVCPGGKKSGKPGYYFHIEPEEESDYLGGNMLAVGHYMMLPEQLRKTREGILSEGAAFDATVRAAETHGFSLGEPDLKRVPAGYPSDSPYSKYLLYKRFCLSKMFPASELENTDKLLPRVLDDFKCCKEFNDMVIKFIWG